MALGKKTGGRKKGVPNRRTVERQIVAIERQERVLASGATPLEVMIADMRFHHDAALAELDRGLDADLAKVAASLTAARTAAKDAAPYIHPRLGAIQHRVLGEDPYVVGDAVAKLGRLLDAEAAVSGASEADQAAQSSQPIRS